MSTGVFRWSFLVLFIGACASKQISVRDLGPEPLPWAGEGNELLEGHHSTGTNRGVLLLFRGSDKGLGVGNIRWGRPIAAENPGVDCLLDREKLGPPTTLFRCRVNGPGRESVAVEVFEDLSSNQRRLSRVALSSTDREAYEHWAQELRINNYQISRKVGDKGVWFVSPDQRTRALLRADRRDVLLIFEPHGS